MIHTAIAENYIEAYGLRETKNGWSAVGALSIAKRPRTGVDMQIREDRHCNLCLVYYKDFGIIDIEELPFSDDGFKEGCRKIAMFARMGIVPEGEFKYEGN